MVYGVKAGIGMLVTILIGLILVTVVIGMCLCRSRIQQIDENIYIFHSMIELVNG